MKQFINKIVFFVAIFLVVAFITTIVTGSVAQKKLAKRGRGVVIDKNNRLDSIRGNKIILVGGSNVCYGINSALMEASLHMPVVDMAINANMGMVFYYEQIKHAINKGDIIIGIPEYEAYKGEDMLGDAGTYSLALIDKRNRAYINWHQWLRLPLYMGDIIKSNVTAYFTSHDNKISNGRYQYNQQGDYFGHQNDSSKSESFKNEKSYYQQNFNKAIYPNKEFINLIQSFASYCSAKQATYLHAYPVYARVMYDASVVAIIQQELQPIKFIGKADSYLYPLDSLYDSPNHLLYKVRNERTLKLINDIKQVLQEH